jgi:hypothetical protein
MRPVSRRVKGVSPGARKATRDVAWQFRGSFGVWLTSLRTTNKDTQRPDEEQIACIRRQIRKLKCQIDILSRDGSPHYASGYSEEMLSCGLAQAIARNLRRLNSVRNERRTSPTHGNENKRTEGSDELAIRRDAFEEKFAGPDPNDSHSFDRSRSESAISSDCEAIIKRLADRLELIEIRSGDQLALKNCEGQIVGLVVKLDPSKSSLSRSGAVELGVDRLLAKIDDLRNEMKLQVIERERIKSTAGAASAPAEAIRCDVTALKELQNATDRRSQDALEALYGAIKHLTEHLVMIDEKLGTSREAAPMSTLRPEPGLEPDAPSIANAPGPSLEEPRDHPIKMRKLDASLLPGRNSNAPWGLSDGFAQGARRSRETQKIETYSNSNAGPAEMTGAIEKEQVESPDIPTDFETVIKKLAERIKSFETRSGERNGCENLEQPTVALPVGAVMTTKQTVPSTQQPILSDGVPEAPAEYGSDAVRTRANAVDPNVASETAPGDTSPPWTVERAARANFVRAARRAALVGERLGQRTARSPAAILMQKRTDKRKVSLVGKLRGRIAALIVSISFIGLAVGVLRLAIVSLDGPDLPPLRPSMSQIDGPAAGSEKRFSNGDGRTEAPAPRKSALSATEQREFAGPPPASSGEAPKPGSGAPPRSAQAASAVIPPARTDETLTLGKGAPSGSEPVPLAAVPSAPLKETPARGKSSAFELEQVALAAVPSAPSDEPPAPGKSSPAGLEQVALPTVSSTPLVEVQAALRGTVSGSTKAPLAVHPPVPRNAVLRELASDTIKYTANPAGPAARQRQALGAGKASHTQGVTNLIVATQAAAIEPPQDPITNLILWLWSLASN